MGQTIVIRVGSQADNYVASAYLEDSASVCSQ